jgi:hypothetical protein
VSWPFVCDSQPRKHMQLIPIAQLQLQKPAGVSVVPPVDDAVLRSYSSAVESGATNGSASARVPFRIAEFDFKHAVCMVGRDALAMTDDNAGGVLARVPRRATCRLRRVLYPVVVRCHVTALSGVQLCFSRRTSDC